MNFKYNNFQFSIPIISVAAAFNKVYASLNNTYNLMEQVECMSIFNNFQLRG